MISPLSIVAARPRDVVADAISRLVVDRSWSGTVHDLYDALLLVTTAEDRAAFAWPRTAAALASRFVSMTEALWDNGLRVTRTPVEIVIERLAPPRSAA